MQSELGGLFYEMAIRDHVQMDVLIEKAAALQRVDAELAQLEHLATSGRRRGRRPLPQLRRHVRARRGVLLAVRDPTLRTHDPLAPGHPPEPLSLRCWRLSALATVRDHLRRGRPEPGRTRRAGRAARSGR